MGKIGSVPFTAFAPVQGDSRAGHWGIPLKLGSFENTIAASCFQALGAERFLRRLGGWISAKGRHWDFAGATPAERLMAMPSFPRRRI
jgi:hypothetical protein